MTAIDWHLKALELVTCNCDVGCPCQFNSLPTNGDCRAAACYRIEEGHFGDTRLDGVTFMGIWAWPGAIHEGKGEGQLVVDVGADDAQFEAVQALFNGEETEPGATIFNVFSTVIDTYHEPLRAPIAFEADVEERTGHFSAPGLIQARGGPIKNPVSGDPHRARVVLPHGFEYHEAEYGRATVSTENSAIPLDYVDTHAHFAHLEWTRNGPVHG